MSLSLDDRMKQYEYVTRTYLTRRIPAIIRIDGKAFHSFTKGLRKPFDAILMAAMRNTMKSLCENIQGCVLGYTQSDEITLVLTDYEKIETDAWFGYNIQKIASISASMATMYFNKFFRAEVAAAAVLEEYKDDSEYLVNLYRKIDTAVFDSRVFSLPKDEVVNCLIWRQQDAVRNSIQSVGQAYFSAKQLDGVPCDSIKNMLRNVHGLIFDDLPAKCKFGSCCYRFAESVASKDRDGNDIMIERHPWKICDETPIFLHEREWIEGMI